MLYRYPFLTSKYRRKTISTAHFQINRYFRKRYTRRHKKTLKTAKARHIARLKERKQRDKARKARRRFKKLIVYGCM